MNEPGQYGHQRRSGRVHIRLPVDVRGTTEDGGAFEEATHTGSVGALGAMVRTSRRLPIGSEVAVTNRFSQQTETFRVVWVGDQQASGLWEVGLEALRRLDDFWGVRFPPKPEQR